MNRRHFFSMAAGAVTAAAANLDQGYQWPLREIETLDCLISEGGEDERFRDPCGGPFRRLQWDGIIDVHFNDKSVERYDLRSPVSLKAFRACIVNHKGPDEQILAGIIMISQQEIQNTFKAYFKPAPPEVDPDGPFYGD